ncbi:BMP family ABC transporter substrate-binding protein [Streptomyces sp. NPDC058861]|uniref:BMP family ABC transporter substrate-binding protein n=1 Tax=Streptomyces sp. NPDC058861 TaxID=3346653 RepID=UPI0036A37C0D
MKTRRTWRASAGKKEPRSGAHAVGLLARVAAVLRGRAGWALASVLVVALGLLGLWLFTGGEESGGPPDARARQYRDFDACLLTGEQGVVAGGPAAPVWEGMQAASEDQGRHIRVTFVPVMGEQTEANARPFLNGLVQRSCEIVVASGAPQTAVAEEAAAKNPKVRFVTVGRTGGAERDNLVRLADGPGVKEEVARTLARLVDGD